MELEYSFPLNLRRMCMVRIGALLLDHPLVGGKVRSYFLQQTNDQQVGTDMLACHSQEGIYNIDLALESFYAHVLPLTLTSELTVAIKSMAIKMFHWYIYVYCQNCGDKKKTISCIRKICWSHYGSIDYRKTFELCWLDNGEITKRDVFQMACNYAFEDHIQAHWEPISTTFPAFSNMSLAMYWQSVYGGSLQVRESELNSQQWIFKFNLFNYMARRRGATRIPIRVFMLMLASIQGHGEAVKYFWDSLDDELRVTYLVPWTNALFVPSNCWYRERYVDICMFYWNRITNKEFVHLHSTFKLHYASFYTDTLPYMLHSIISCSLSYFYSLWPWQDKFTNILQKLLSYPELWDCYKVVPLTYIISNILRSYYDFDKSRAALARRMTLVYITWRTIPKSIKMLCTPIFYANFLTALTATEHGIQIMKLIVNDEMLNSIRNELIEEISQNLLSSSDESFDLVEGFLNAITSSEVEKKSFMQRLCIADYPVGNSDNIDNFFKWQYETHEEYSLFRAKLNAMEYWNRIMQKQNFERAFTFINWYFFSVKEDIAAFKKILLNTAHPRDLIIEYWCTNGSNGISYAAILSRCFLYWLLENDEAVAAFIRNTLVDQSAKIPVNNSEDWRRSDFLEWCSLDVTSTAFRYFGLIEDDYNYGSDSDS